MPLTHTFETGRRKQRFLGVEREVVSTITYRLSPRPYRLHSRLDLPKSYELEDHETDEDEFNGHRGRSVCLRVQQTVEIIQKPLSHERAITRWTDTRNRPYAP